MNGKVIVVEMLIAHFAIIALKLRFMNSTDKGTFKMARKKGHKDGVY